MKIVYALMASHAGRDRFVARNVDKAFHYGNVDQVIFVNGGSHHFEIEDWDRVRTIRRPWRDNFPEQRNVYLRGVDEWVAAQEPDDVLVCTADDDEFYSAGLWYSIRDVAENAFENDFNHIAIRCHSVVLDLEGKKVRETVDEYWKALIFAWEPNVHYIAKGSDRQTLSTDSFVHEFLVIPSGARYTRLNDNLYYEHHKTELDVWLRAARNFWAGGGGPNLGSENPLWQPFKDLVRLVDSTIETSMDFEYCLQRGGIDERIKEAILDLRHIGTDYDPRTNLWRVWPDGTSEMREVSRYYFAIHPNELPTSIREADEGKIDWAYITGAATTAIS